VFHTGDVHQLPSMSRGSAPQLFLHVDIHRLSQDFSRRPLLQRSISLLAAPPSLIQTSQHLHESPCLPGSNQTTSVRALGSRASRRSRNIAHFFQDLLVTRIFSFGLGDCLAESQFRLQFELTRPGLNQVDGSTQLNAVRASFGFRG
jgi:hypothetical protein